MVGQNADTKSCTHGGKPRGRTFGQIHLMTGDFFPRRESCGGFNSSSGGALTGQHLPLHAPRTVEDRGADIGQLRAPS